ncbi:MULTISPECIES: fatty acid--CoA ligase [Paraburkholderia]|jgi:fatty-acyl-CoA synthase|uniref:AMP-dependent synthetase and ligase n=1 Tax=Paraburkholderia hospita TaxID=169430 RepID=A0AAN1MPI2_9BURK|nr:fatty acid--CoA ligase [Paraburkholderia hospita]SKD02658.1 Acyl-CoA synthetase (AMP-forming)/AMP-acid ligase II [Burkholderia sp. CF099]AUT74677.1 fatty acid--CoA ligase [Paraburkholderia hospita]EIN02605.1 AMP-dependent synthetase and ligase [Paraburkholderia hospita]OUL82174.1 long-chain fatty acid--CoA ligase [Paraburkholderia hospita]OUL96199.1 long-chain fatty acid--CoA ligase [Paraburkholderia hospita]
MQDAGHDSTPTPYAYPLLIKHLLHTTFIQAPDQEIVYRGQLRMTYTTMRERIARLANGLHDLGVRHGTTVAVMDWDSHRYLESYFAVPMMGAVLQTVNVRLSHAEIAYTINHSGAEVLFVHTDFLPVVEAIKDQLETVRVFVWIDEPGSDACEHTIPFATEYEAMLAASATHYDFPDFDENTRATTFYTTGTTGLPKGVYFSHRQLVLHTITLMAALASPVAGQRFHRGDVYMPLTPMFHVHAWGMPYIATVLGVKQVYPGRYVPERLVQLVRDEGVTFSHCVSTILHMLLSCDEAKHVDLGKWKVVIGGGALPHGLARAALDRGIDVFVGYGMSETCPVLSLAQLPLHTEPLDLDEEVRLRCKTGFPVPLVDLRIVNEHMEDVPRDGKAYGEIVVRTPWLTQGYLNNPEASAQLWAGGYLHTQDIANIDPTGNVQITDRIKDVIKSGGEWISSLEIESLISLHPGVAEVAVIGIKDEKWGERPVALVVLRQDAQVSEDDVKQHVLGFSKTGQISKYAVPQIVRFVDALQKTSVGKTNKKWLREQFA